MFDFFYRETRYRAYRRMNDLVEASERQVASGIPGEEYLVYDEDGGRIRLDLTGTADGRSFDVLWYDPASGESRTGSPVRGGATLSLDSPFGEDTVLLLRRS